MAGEQSPNFEGDYADTLIVETKGAPLRFFLPDYGLHDKKETTDFIEAVEKAWKAAKHSR